MSAIIERVADRETVGVEVWSGLDGQGLPSYAASVDIEVHVRRTDKFIIQGDGSKLAVPLTLYVPPDATVVPGEQDRVTVDSDTFIGAELTSPRRLRAGRDAPDHYRLRCKRGG